MRVGREKTVCPVHGQLHAQVKQMQPIPLLVGSNPRISVSLKKDKEELRSCFEQAECLPVQVGHREQCEDMVRVLLKQAYDLIRVVRPLPFHEKLFCFLQ